MSRGPGKIEKAIEAAFEAASKAYTTQDLFYVTYPDAEVFERKHRVAIKRAAKNVCERTEWTHLRDERRGGGLIYYNPFNVMSYAIARKKGDMFSYYQRRGAWRQEIEAEIEAWFAVGGKHHDLICEGGAWWEDVQRAIAKRDGDGKTYDILTQKREADLQAFMTTFKTSVAR